MSTPVSAKQISFYNSLLDQISRLGDFAPEVIAVAREAFPAKTTSDASEAIKRATATVARLRVAKAAAPKPSVVSGFYAIVDAAEITKFYKVEVVTEGKWAGRTFVKVQASDDLYPIKGETAKAVLALIAADPAGASKRYGHSLGKCGVCGRTLTDEVSRANGIGPICANKNGW